MSFGSTGRANRLTPPSQCQRSCEDIRTRKNAFNVFEADEFRRFGCVAGKLTGLPGVARGYQPGLRPLGYAGQASLRYRVAKPGGADRDRTDDLKLAKLALSQLSYGPDSEISQLQLRWLARAKLRYPEPGFVR